VCLVVQGDVLESSIDKDMHCKCMGQMGAGKYQRESCHHHIECFVANSLAALMRK